MPPSYGGRGIIISGANKGHQFADDTQLLVSMDSTDGTPAIDRLAHFSAAVHLWFLQNKSEVVFLGTAAQLPTSLYCRRRQKHSAGLTAAQVAWRDWHEQLVLVRLPREKRCE